MKTTLLFVGASLCVISCVDSNAVNPEKLSTEEMKSKVEVEEIEFDDQQSMDSNISSAATSGGERDIVISNELKDEFKSQIQELPVLFDCGNAENPDKNGVYLYAEIDPQYPGGMIELRKFINENIQYPRLEACTHGAVYISMIVRQDGTLSEVEVIRGLSEEQNQEAIRLVKAMPNWIPAEQSGKIVAAKVRLPIRFELN